MDWMRSERRSRDRGARSDGRGWDGPLEPLEPRLLMSGDAPIVEAFVADNRGLIEFQIGRSVLEASLLDQSSISVTTTGADLLFGTGDDVQEQFTVEYDANANVLRVDAGLEADTRYSVTLDASIIQSVKGVALDGEFNGPGEASGDGEAGGSFTFFTRAAASPVARFSTSLGVIDVQLFPQTTPQSVENFLNLANDGLYDGVIFHRLVEDFVIQGGGFSSEFPFGEIPEPDPVVNEPFLSNTRGTIAYAKLGGQPNSATTQWFFNLTDNSENLDNQNGGFTVFGEIVDDASLAVMDALAALGTFDASSLGSAFTDLPILDDADFAGANDLMAQDLAVVSRVATIMDAAAAPFDDLGAVAVDISSDAGVTVRVFDLDGTIGADALAEHVRVNFGSGGRGVSAVTITNRLDAGRVGVSIGGADWVNRIVDQRGDDSGGVGFIVSNASVNTINLRGDLTGFDINGLTLGGMALPSDIDGDGSSTDLTSAFIDGQAWRAVVRGDVGGDIVAEEGVGRIVVRGDMEEASIVAGALENEQAVSTLILGRLEDVSISVQSPIGLLRAQEWEDNGPRDTLVAPSARNVRITGGGDSDGNFEADLLLTGGSDDPFALRTLFVRGSVNDSDIETPTSVRSIVIRGDAGLIDASIGGDLRLFRAGAVSTMDLNVEGETRGVIVDEWIGGELITGSLNRLITRGDNGRDIDGDLAINLATTDDMRADRSPIARLIRVRGDAHTGAWELSGDAGRIFIDGESRDMSIGAERTLDMFRAGVVEETVISAGNDIRRVDASSWEGGGVQGGSIERLTIAGDGRLGVEGDFVDAEISTSRLGRIFIRGDVSGSAIRAALPAEASLAIEQLIIRGTMESSVVRTLGRVGQFETGNMLFSSFFAGAPIDAEQFPPQEDVEAEAAVDSVRVRSVDRDRPAMSASYIVGGQIGDLDLGQVEENNFGIPYGVAAFEIDDITYRAGPGNNGFGQTVRPFAPRFAGEGVADLALGDFEIRLDFDVPPTGESV